MPNDSCCIISLLCWSGFGMFLLGTMQKTSGRRPTHGTRPAPSTTECGYQWLSEHIIICTAEWPTATTLGGAYDKWAELESIVHCSRATAGECSCCEGWRDAIQPLAKLLWILAVITDFLYLQRTLTTVLYTHFKYLCRNLHLYLCSFYKLFLLVVLLI